MTASGPMDREGGPVGSLTEFRLPRTVSRPALLAGGTDRRFRGVLYDLCHLGTLLERARRHLAAVIGVTPPQYTILMVIAEIAGDGGVGVGEVAAHTHVSAPFVTSEINKLVALGLILKSPNPDDRRGVLLRRSPAAAAKIDGFAAHLRRFNDSFFASLSGSDLRRLGEMVSGIVHSGEHTLADVAPRLAAPPAPGASAISAAPAGPSPGKSAPASCRNGAGSR
ncbi:MAG: winged helix-turn-helix transcriptional regulator [Telmatospirillum sp.]|nr:winged helix-turn-helix transcriptional regulator [Telmatospirillum sp.]